MKLKRLFILVLLLLLSLLIFVLSSLDILGIGSPQNAYINLDATSQYDYSLDSPSLNDFGVKSPTKQGKVFLIFIDRVVLSDFYDANTPNLDLLVQQGGIGLMTTNTGGSRSQRDAYLTMGAGTRVSASDKSPLGLHLDEIHHGVSAGDLYKQITGKAAQEGAIVNLGFAQAIRNNRNRSYTVNIGALGTAIKQAGLRSAVIGNSDTSGEVKRYLVSFMMDDEGVVPAGEVGRSTLLEDQGRPFGIRTDYSKIIESIDDLCDSVDVFAVELGDTSRAEDFRYEATDDMNQWYKRVAIEEGDAFIGELIQRMNLNQDLLVIASALGSSNDLAENNRLTPIMVMGKGFSKGLLVSASTKRPGILTNLDISTTVLSHYGIGRQGGQLGNRIHSSGEEMEVGELLKYNGLLKEVNNQRASLLRTYVTIMIILLIAALICIFFLRKYLVYAEVLPTFFFNILWLFLFPICSYPFSTVQL